MSDLQNYFLLLTLVQQSKKAPAGIPPVYCIQISGESRIKNPIIGGNSKGLNSEGLNSGGLNSEGLNSGGITGGNLTPIFDDDLHVDLLDPTH